MHAQAVYPQNAAAARQRAAVAGSVVLSEWAATRPGARERQGREQAVQANLERGDGPITQKELAAALGGLPSFSGATVTERTALAIAAVYACVGLIGGAVASLPLHVYERTPNGREKVDHPYWWLLNEQPHQDYSAAVFWEFMLASLLLQGDAFAEIQRSSMASAKAVGFKPIHKRNIQIDDTDPSRSDLGRVYRVFDPDTATMRTLLPNDVLHVPGIGFDGKYGLSQIGSAGRNAFGLAISAEQWSGDFFANGARPDFILRTDGNLKPEQVEVLKTSWMARHQGGGRSHLPAVLAGGLHVEPLSIPNKDAELIATRGFQIEDICRIFGVPPHMVGHTEKASSWGTGIEQMGRGFVKFTLQRHLVKIEQELNRKLWPTRQKYFFEFNVGGLERGDLKSENESYRIALGRAGEPSWMTVNEVRRLKNLPPVEGGDELPSLGADAAMAANEPSATA